MDCRGRACSSRVFQSQAPWAVPRHTLNKDGNLPPLSGTSNRLRGLPGSIRSLYYGRNKDQDQQASRQHSFREALQGPVRDPAVMRTRAGAWGRRPGLASSGEFPQATLNAPRPRRRCRPLEARRPACTAHPPDLPPPVLDGRGLRSPARPSDRAGLVPGCRPSGRSLVPRCLQTLPCDDALALHQSLLRQGGRGIGKSLAPAIAPSRQKHHLQPGRPQRPIPLAQQPQPGQVLARSAASDPRPCLLYRFQCYEPRVPGAVASGVGCGAGLQGVLAGHPPVTGSAVCPRRQGQSAQNDGRRGLGAPPLAIGTRSHSPPSPTPLTNTACRTVAGQATHRDCRADCPASRPSAQA